MNDSWLENAEERRKLTAILHEKHQREKARKARERVKAERDKVEQQWKAACELGKETGCVSLCNLDMKSIGNSVYTFPDDYGRVLKELRLDGIGLSSLGKLPTRCRDLEKLSLASNHIQDISNIHFLGKLTQLNLLKNQIMQLPSTVNLLTNLTRMEVANNSLTDIPAELSKLRGLKHLNLECNRLAELPVALGRLDCETLNLSNNKFTVCPPCVVDMKNLRRLSINYNEIGVLPGGLHKLKKLESLHASKNRIIILPDSIVDMASLHSLWFDYNQLSALPPNFHKLTKLQELKLEGNPDFVYPPIDIVARGTEDVLRWSRQRLELSKTAKMKHIVESLNEVLKQVHRYKIGGALHESLFQVIGDEFQFPPFALWTIFLPELSKMWTDPTQSANNGIKSFPYERAEVERAMFEFRDAAGPILRKTAHGRFRMCSCVETRGSSTACIPMQGGSMCTRPALLLRKICYEENMKEKRRQVAEEKAIEVAESAAKKIANAFLESDEGIMTVREEALKVAAVQLPQKSALSQVLKKLPLPSSIKQKPEAKARLKRIEEDIRQSHMREKLAEARNQVIERNKKMVVVMQSWMGLSLFEAFDGWRFAVEKVHSQRRREERHRLKEERLAYESALSLYEYQVIEHTQWHESWDFNDCSVWVHAESKLSQYHPPNIPPPPPIPSSLLDPATGEKFTPEQFFAHEADSESEFSSVDSILSSAEDNNDGTTKLDPDQAPKGAHSEVKLAKERVLAQQRSQVRAKYNR